MNMDPRQQKGSLVPPRDGKAGRKKIQERGARHGGRQGGGSPEETEAHAKEVKALMRGQDIVEGATQADLVEQTPAAFDGSKMKVVRSWMNSRPLEPVKQATTMVPYPRSWNTKRGRYCKFKAPGAGVYGILRARPTF
ncbi:MAG: hypothetical protein AAF658_12465 [Myxococcota bacterium]